MWYLNTVFVYGLSTHGKCKSFIYYNPLVSLRSAHKVLTRFPAVHGFGKPPTSSLSSSFSSVSISSSAPFMELSLVPFSTGATCCSISVPSIACDLAGCWGEAELRVACGGSVPWVGVAVGVGSLDTGGCCCCFSSSNLAVDERTLLQPQ